MNPGWLPVFHSSLIIFPSLSSCRSPVGKTFVPRHDLVTVKRLPIFCINYAFSDSCDAVSNPSTEVTYVYHAHVCVLEVICTFICHWKKVHVELAYKLRPGCINTCTCTWVFTLGGKDILIRIGCTYVDPL